MVILKCCVGGCTANSDTHQLLCIPKNDNLRSLWLSFLVPTNPRLGKLSKSQLITKRVCSKHFDEQQFDQEGRRLRYSYPCLFSELEIALGEPRNIHEWNLLTEHNYFQKSNEVCILESTLSYTANTVDIIPAQRSHSNACLDSQSKDYCSMKASSAITAPAHALWAQPSCSYSTPSDMKSNTIAVMKQKDCIRRKPNTIKRKFMKEIISIRHKLSNNSLSEQLQQVLAKPNIFANYYALPKQARTFIQMQLKHANKNKMARRFSIDEKLMALCILKQSPKTYHLLEKMFTLPNKRTLSRLSENVDFAPGINPHVFEHIKQTVQNWTEQKKLCTILFDEVALTPHITFDEKKDEVIGLVDINGEKKMQNCDHALVFMVRGICASWRQCLAYHLVQGTVPAADLKVALKNIVTQVSQAGLIPIALVCDQGSTFRTAIRYYRLETIRSRTLAGLIDDGTIDVEGHNLNIFYDPPHLLKSIRNNFINKDALWGDNTASWEDILFIFDVDSKLGHTRALPKLTTYHVDRKKLKKMKVSIAAQVLSARTAAMLKYTNAICQSPSSTMETTAEFVEFMDNLFDSVNGCPNGTQKGKLRKSVKPNSAHKTFWTSAVQKLKAMKFIDSKSKFAQQSGPRLVRVPCLDGWITSLESFIRISNLLFTKYNVDFYYPRYINQDPLENFFGRLRALNYRNVNPTPTSFIHAYKTLMLSNILSPLSRFTNCEQDEGETLMNFIKILDNISNIEEKFDNKENVSPNTSNNNVTSCSLHSPKDLVSQIMEEKIKVHCSAYTAGYICRFLSKTLSCEQCQKTYTSNNIDGIHMYLNYREYKHLKHKRLAYPNGSFLRLYQATADYIHNYLNAYCTNKNLTKKCNSAITQNLYLIKSIGCNKHKNEIKELFLKITNRMQVHNWCRIINKILKGAVEAKYVLKMQEPQKMALKMYNNRLRMIKKN